MSTFLDTMNGTAAYFRFFDQHRIWLPEELCKLLDNFAGQLRTPTIQHGVYLDIANPNEKTLQEQRKVWDEAWQPVSSDIPRLRSAIEAEFRTLLNGENLQ